MDVPEDKAVGVWNMFYLNYISDILVVWAAILFYFTNNFFASFLRPEAKEFLLYVAVFYSVILLYFSYIKAKKGQNSSGYKLLIITNSFLHRFYKFISKSESIESGLSRSLSDESKRVFLFALVKLYYIPVMLNFAVNNYYQIDGHLLNISENSPSFNYIAFNEFFYPLMLAALFFVDTVFFVFGYLFEAEFLKNKVRSVDATFFGWFVALICYPPFTDAVSVFAPWHTNDMAYYNNDLITFAIRIVIVLLLIIYVGASVSLGTKCSNLTNRGIVSVGTYRIVRHPAYISKVLIWWIISLPAFQFDALAILSMLFWTLVYYFRAITEERHLNKDPEYQEYCTKVKYRFIPSLY